MPLLFCLSHKKGLSGCRILLVTLTLLSISSVSALSKATPNQQDTLAQQRWGQVLYEFYQENYRAGLVQLAIAEQQGLAEHNQQAQVAKGGMSLVFGLNHQAEQILTDLTQTQNSQVQEQAWFWLSKRFFESGQYVKAQKGLDKTQKWRSEYDNYQQEQLAYMQGQLLLAAPNQTYNQEQFSRALNRLPEDSIYRPYLDYNIGILQLDRSEYSSAINALQNALKHLTTQSTSSWQNTWWASWTNNLWSTPTVKMSQTEYQGLTDRIHLALGYAYLNNMNTEQALTHFSNVHRQRQDAANALLGYGQALVNQGNLPMALAIWQKISVDYPASAPALQGLLAMTWQLEQAGDEVQAWQKLLVTENQLAVAQQHIVTSLQLINKGDFLPNILKLTQDKSPFDSSKESTEAVDYSWPQSQGDILQSLLAGQSKEQLDSWIDLQQERILLNNKQQDLAEFSQLLDERKQTTLERGARLKQQDFVKKTDDLDKQLQVLNEQVIFAQSTLDASVFANETQLAQLARIKRAKARIAQIMASRDLSPQYAERLARIEGLLTWHFADNFAPLLWQHQQAIADTQQLLNKTKHSQTRLLKQISSPAQYAQQYQKIATLSERVNDSLGRIQGLQQGLSKQVTTKAVKALTARQKYLAEVEQSIQLAKLRLQDKDPQQIFPSSTEMGKQ